MKGGKWESVDTIGKIMYVQARTHATIVRAEAGGTRDNNIIIIEFYYTLGLSVKSRLYVYSVH